MIIFVILEEKEERLLRIYVHICIYNYVHVDISPSLVWYNTQVPWHISSRALASVKGGREAGKKREKGGKKKKKEGKKDLT